MAEELLVHPIAGRHAIEVMAFAIEWGRPLTDDVLGDFQLLYERSSALKEFLPRAEPVQNLVVQFGNEGAAVSTPSSGGAQWIRGGSDGNPEWVVSVQANVLVCTCMAYERWASIKPQALSVLMPLATTAMRRGHPIQAIGLQYQDAFRVAKSAPTTATERLFRSDSRWLSPRVWTEDGPWHVHQGWFSSSDSGRLVHNLLNVDLVTEPDCELFRINGQHRALALSRHGNVPRPFEVEEVSTVLDGLHTANKLALHQLLSENVQTQIGLSMTEEKI